MTDPTTDPDPTPAAGRLAVAGTDLQVRWSRRGDTTEVEIEGDHLDDGTPDRAAAVAVTIAEVTRRPEVVGSSLQLAADHPADDWHALPDAVADEIGLAGSRLLLELRRPLPVPADHPERSGPSLPIRPVAPDDDDAWIRANNRAFATHPDQGREDASTLAARRAEDWYDAAGFLVADDPDRPGELAGFCWTKVHPATADDPALGEIYVIGVDPAHRGEGLGAGFVLAGLDHLAAQGITVADLYVEGDNAAALALYDRLGFSVHRRRRVYTW